MRIINIRMLGILMFLITFNLNASDRIGIPVRIVSICFQNEDLTRIEKIIDKEGTIGTDIIILPETWRGQKKPETLEGETITTLSSLAKKHNNISCHRSIDWMEMFA